MNSSPNPRQLLRRTLAALILCAVIVALCYFFIDRPIAFYVHNRWGDDSVLKWLTYPPPILQAWTPVALVVLMVRRVYGSFRRWELAILAACLSLVMADQFRETLAYVFGRLAGDLDRRQPIVDPGWRLWLSSVSWR